MLFYSLRKIKVGEQLLCDYGKNFDGVSNCMKDCLRCLKQSRLRFSLIFGVIKGLYFLFLHKGQVWFNVKVCVECNISWGEGWCSGMRIVIICSILVLMDLVKIILLLVQQSFLGSMLRKIYFEVWVIIVGTITLIYQEYQFCVVIVCNI